MLQSYGYFTVGQSAAESNPESSAGGTLKKNKQVNIYIYK